MSRPTLIIRTAFVARRRRKNSSDCDKAERKKEKERERKTIGKREKEER